MKNAGGWRLRLHIWSDEWITRCPWVRFVAQRDLWPLAAWRECSSRGRRGRHDPRWRQRQSTNTRANGLAETETFDMRFTRSTRFMCFCTAQQALLQFELWRIVCRYTAHNVFIPERDHVTLQSKITALKLPVHVWGQRLRGLFIARTAFRWSWSNGAVL